MTGQQTLALDGPPWARDPIGQRWLAFHRAHPEVGAEFVRLAREWRQHQPKARVGAKAIWEVLRWNMAVGQVPTTSSEPFRLNNVYPALYARWSMDCHPDLAGVFETRRRHST